MNHELKADDYRTTIIRLLNDWTINGTTRKERQHRTDLTWRVMEELETDIHHGSGICDNCLQNSQPVTQTSRGKLCKVCAGDVHGDGETGEPIANGSHN